MKQQSLVTRRGVLAAGLSGSVLSGLSAYGQQETVQPPAQENAKRVLRFAHLTDTHVLDARHADEGFAQCLQHVQAQEDAPELIVFGGDNVMNVDSEDGSKTADQQLAVWNRVVEQECSLPHKYVVGNHDILKMDPVDGKQWAVDAYGLDHRFYHFDQAGWRFIVLDSTSPQEGGGYKGRLDEEQFDWLRETIESTPETTPICLISHIPILAACAYFDGNNEESGDWCVPGAWMHLDARKLKGLFYENPNVRLSISGHIHLVDTVEYLGVKYACNGAVSGGWWHGPNQEFKPGYALVDLYEDGTSNVEYVPYGWIAKD